MNLNEILFFIHSNFNYILKIPNYMNTYLTNILLYFIYNKYILFMIYIIIIVIIIINYTLNYLIFICLVLF